MFLTGPASLDEDAKVRSGRTLVLIALLAVQPIGVLAASYVSKHDPVGEKVYASGTLRRLAPLAISAGGLSLAWLLDRARRKANRRAADNAGPHHA
jgi:hypothetical protein